MKKSYKNLIKISALTLSFVISADLAKPVFASEITPENVIFLINKERVYDGLRPLRTNPELMTASKTKSEDMANKNYFEHYAFGLTPWVFMQSAGYNYLYAGENLAMNFDTAEGMVNAWLNSPSHRANILSEDYEDIGVGVVKGVFTQADKSEETTLVTNMFGRKKPAILESFDRLVSSISRLIRF